MANVFDVSAYILEKTGTVTHMKLQKLVYYAQAWSLVWDEAPLFDEQIEAWANGPVVRRLFACFRQSFTVSRTGLPVGASSDNLTRVQKETIDAVLSVYGDKTPQWLSDLTHMEDPWRKARRGLQPNERGQHVISHADMAWYYDSLKS